MIFERASSTRTLKNHSPIGLPNLAPCCEHQDAAIVDKNELEPEDFGPRFQFIPLFPST